MGESETVIVLDPIDGSSNAVAGIPYFGSAAALQKGGRTVEAFVVNLACGDYFYKNEEHFVRGRLERPDATFPVRNRRNVPVGIFEKPYARVDLAEALLERKIKFRAPGAVALSLAYAHDTDFVIFAGPRRRYDFAAALWMCEDLHVIEEEELLIVAKTAQRASELHALSKQQG